MPREQSELFEAQDDATTVDGGADDDAEIDFAMMSTVTLLPCSRCETVAHVQASETPGAKHPHAYTCTRCGYAVAHKQAGEALARWNRANTIH